MGVEDWIESALRDLRRARRCLEDGDFECTCFYAQQAVEKALKAYLMRFGNFLRTHDLSRLADRCLIYGLDLRAHCEELKMLSAHY